MLFRSLLEHAHALKVVREAEAWGVMIPYGAPAIDMTRVHARKDKVVTGLTKGIEFLFKKNKIDWIKGTARLAGKGTVEVFEGDKQTLTAKEIVIATGSTPRSVPGIEIDHKRIITSDEAIHLPQVPKSLVIMGSGAVGVEFASIFRRFGSDVSIVEFLPHLVAAEDEDAVKQLEKSFAAEGIDLHLGARATRVEESADGVVLHFESADGPGSVTGDLILVATGRAPNVGGLGLDDIGVAYDEKRGIRTDGTRRTGQPHIYAVGDVAGYWQLAHSAFREGEIAAENIAGHHVEFTGHVPRCIYTEPEIGAVGLTDAQAREQYGDDVTTGSFPFAAIARAAMHGDKTGFVKTIHAGPYDELVGVIAVGTNATEIVNAGVIALDAEATIETIADSVAAHPTLAEGLKEAALVSLGRPIHLPPMKRRSQG